MKDPASDALKVSECQTAILRTLVPLKREARQRVLTAILHLLEADRQVPGIFESFRKARGEEPSK